MPEGVTVNQDPTFQKATFAGGCFWCMQDAFEGLEGVINVVSGYAGGHKQNPTYEEVSSGTTVTTKRFKSPLIPREYPTHICWIFSGVRSIPQTQADSLPTEAHNTKPPFSITMKSRGFWRRNPKRNWKNQRDSTNL